MNVLRIDSSARNTDSVSRQLGDTLLNALATNHAIKVTAFDSNDAVPHVSSDWINASYTPVEERSDAQRAILTYSDARVDELKAADLVVITLPMYNFSIPASLKAWIDMVARAGLTFKYTENGPVGLLDGKRAIVLMTSGGVPVGSPVDFAAPYLKHVLGFIGIIDVTVIDATGLVSAPDAAAVVDAANDAAVAFAEAV